MTHRLYIYDGPPADAVRHLLTASSLRKVTETEPYYWAGDDCTLVKLTRDTDEAQHELWTAAQAIGNEVGFVDITAAARQLNAIDKAALIRAMTIAMGEDEEVAS